MKTLEELQAEFPNPAELKLEMVKALNMYSTNMKPEIHANATFNWQLKLHEFIIRLFTEDEEQQEQALAMFRSFAQDSHLASMYAALVASMEKKIVIAK